MNLKELEWKDVDYIYLYVVFFWVIPRRLNIWHIKLRRQGITQKKTTYYIQNTAKV